MRSIAFGIMLLSVVPAKADNILLIRGADQIIFQGMDVLGRELQEDGHHVVVSSPFLAASDTSLYDVVIGNSQGAATAMNRPQNWSTKFHPRLIVTIDIPPHWGWKAHKGVKHLNIRGPMWGIIRGGRNVLLYRSHFALSYSGDMRRMVHHAVNIW